MKGFLSIGFTSPGSYPGEAAAISRFLETGMLDFVHIRKPGWSAGELRRLIEAIPERWHRRLKLHDHFELLDQYQLGGVHLNRRNPVAPSSADEVSCSVHSLEQLEDWRHYKYMTLSPVFDSISKPGYTARFDFTELSRHVAGRNIIALGGVTPDKFPVLKATGFAGAAMLGCLWPGEGLKENK